MKLSDPNLDILHTVLGEKLSSHFGQVFDNNFDKSPRIGLVWVPSFGILLWGWKIISTGRMALQPLSVQKEVIITAKLLGTSLSTWF